MAWGIKDRMVKKRQIFNGTQKELFELAKSQGMFELEFLELDSLVKGAIKTCEGKHIQQVCYSTYHDALTQICFGCNMIRTSLKKEEVQKR